MAKESSEREWERSYVTSRQLDQRFEQSDKFITQRFQDTDKAVNAALAAAKEAVGAALAASEKAVDKAEGNAEKWRDSANEWRGAMSDREREFLTRREFYGMVGTLIALITLVGGFIAFVAPKLQSSPAPTVAKPQPS